MTRGKNYVVLIIQLLLPKACLTRKRNERRVRQQLNASESLPHSTRSLIFSVATPQPGFSFSHNFKRPHHQNFSIQSKPCRFWSYTINPIYSILFCKSRFLCHGSFWLDYLLIPLLLCLLFLWIRFLGFFN